MTASEGPFLHLCANCGVSVVCPSALYTSLLHAISRSLSLSSHLSRRSFSSPLLLLAVNTDLSTHFMTPEELATLFKRRGDFDSTRKDLLVDFQNSVRPVFFVPCLFSATPSLSPPCPAFLCLHCNATPRTHSLFCSQLVYRMSVNNSLYNSTIFFKNASTGTQVCYSATSRNSIR